MFVKYINENFYSPLYHKVSLFFWTLICHWWKFYSLIVDSSNVSGNQLFLLYILENFVTTVESWSYSFSFFSIFSRLFLCPIDSFCFRLSESLLLRSFSRPQREIHPVISLLSFLLSSSIRVDKNQLSQAENVPLNENIVRLFLGEGTREDEPWRVENGGVQAVERSTFGFLGEIKKKRAGWHARIFQCKEPCRTPHIDNYFRSQPFRKKVEKVDDTPSHDPAEVSICEMWNEMNDLVGETDRCEWDDGITMNATSAENPRICLLPEDLEVLEDPRTTSLRRISYGIILPTICCFGIVGNVLNLLVLTRRNMRGTAYIYMRGEWIVRTCISSYLRTVISTIARGNEMFNTTVYSRRVFDKIIRGDRQFRKGWPEEKERRGELEIRSLAQTETISRYLDI